MTYGAVINNSFGERVVDFSRSLVIKETGVSISSVDCGITFLISNFWNFSGPLSVEMFNVGGGGNQAFWIDSHPHFLKPQSVFFPNTENFNTPSKHPSPLVDPSSLYFYQVGTIGLAHHSEHTISPPWAPPHGMFAVCLPVENVPLPFLRVDTLPLSNLMGDYGMQIRNATGDVVFDTRSDFLSISEVLFVPKATIQDIIDNDAVVNLTLRTAVPGAYIAAPNHTSFFRETGPSARYRHVVIEQPAPSTIRLKRYLHGPFLNLSHSQEIGINNDLVLIVARNPFA